MPPPRENAGWGPIRSLLCLSPLLLLVPWLATRQHYPDGNFHKPSSLSPAYFPFPFYSSPSRAFNRTVIIRPISRMRRFPSHNRIFFIESNQVPVFRKSRKRKFSHMFGTFPRKLGIAPLGRWNTLSLINGWSTRPMKSKRSVSDWSAPIRVGVS